MTQSTSYQSKRCANQNSTTTSDEMEDISQLACSACAEQFLILRESENLRIRIPVSDEEEEDNFWTDGWSEADEWTAYYDYQDYLAELREAQHQLMSDVWDW